MVKKTQRKGLGRGLSALLADVDLGSGEASNTKIAEQTRGQNYLPIEQVKPNPDQPRRDFAEADLADLTASIREKGIIQPLIVRPDPKDPDSFQIVAGERRWRAAQRARLHELPVLIRQLEDTEVLEVAIIENIQRSDLNAVEEAAGYQQLMEKFGHTQERLAEALGKSRSHIANLLRLLKLPESVQNLLREGKLSAGHARALITTDNPEALAREIVAKGLSVRQAEHLARNKNSPKTERSTKASRKDADTRALEDTIRANLHLKVNIAHKPGGQSGEVRITYQNLTDLDGLVQLLTQ